MIEYIPELINAKIDAFKIEGRMKDPLYVKTVVECYKEALDSYFNKTYTKENPLFGRIVGRIWWQPHIRGNKDQGLILKDYDVKHA